MKAVYTMADLADLPRDARLGVVGNPIAHSLSPPMQQAALDADGRGFTYVRLLGEREGGDEQNLARLLAQLREVGFLGVNVTVPFKKAAYALADEADALSQLCGAANTLVFRGDKICCYNTDGPGFARAVQELCGRPLGQLRVLLLGACGGAGSALAAQAVLDGCPSLTLVNRPRPELEQLAELLRSRAKTTQVSALTFDAAELPQAVQESDLVVNATSLGLAAGDTMSPLPSELLRSGQVVYDIITHSTPLTRAAEARGCTVATGQSMLLWQGALAYERWFGVLPAVEEMRRALMAASA